MAETGPLDPAEDAARRRRRAVPWVAGVSAVVVLVTLVVAVATDDDPEPSRRRISSIDVPDSVFPPELAERLSPPAPARVLPRATLRVHADGCGVIRSDVPSDTDGLTWSISDTDGFQVLQRNAAGEIRYRYFRPGTYTVALEAWDGDSYSPISNTVTIHC